MRFDFTTVRLFVAVAEERNIAHAARRENIVASAVSKRIQDLEFDTGVKLLRRHRGGVELTEAGQSFYDHCVDILAALDRASCDLDQYAKAVRGDLKIAATMSTALQSLPHELSKFLRNHPAIEVEVLERPSNEVVRMVRDGTAHVGIFATNISAGELRTFAYRTDTLCVVTPADHPLAGRSEVSFAETLNYPHVSMNSHSPLRPLLRDQAAALGRVIDTALSATSFDAVRALVGAGLGVGVLPEVGIKPYESSNGVRGIRLSDSWAQRELRLCVREDQTYLPGKLFIDQLAAPA